MMDEHSARKLEQVEKDLHLTKHRLHVLEQEQLPRRVASMEPTVTRLEQKLESLGAKFDAGLAEVKAAIVAQKSMQKGVVVTVVTITGAIQLIPYIKVLFQ